MEVDINQRTTAGHTKTKTTKDGQWSDKKRKVAEYMAEGTYSQRDIAKIVGVYESSITRWKRDPAFRERVDEYTFALERHSLAGMLRRLDLKQEETDVKKDEWSKLEEMKHRILGLEKQRIEHSGTVDYVLKWASDDDVDYQYRGSNGQYVREGEGTAEVSKISDGPPHNNRNKQA